MKGLIKQLLRESLLDEEAMRLKHLPKEVGLFVRGGGETTLVLMDPTTNDVYAMIDANQINDNYHVGGVAAETGFGPFIYELMMMLLNIKGKGLMPNREGDIKQEAFEVWARFFSRNDVRKEIIEPFNLDGSFNKKYRVDILTGEHDTFHDSEDFREFYTELSKNDKNVLNIFNCVYYLQPNNDYSVLLNRGLAYEHQGVSLVNVIRKGNEYFSKKYSESL